MTIDSTWAWGALIALGAFHGINPGMGWLFAVALGLQDQRRTAVWRSLGPMALGHGLAIGVAILVVMLLGHALPVAYLKWGVAGTLFSFGIYRLVRTRHPRYGGMKVKAYDLTVWSFLMASAHGAGLMVLPFLFGSPTAPSHQGHEVALPHAEVHVMAHAPDVGMMGPDHSNHATALLTALPDVPLVGLLAILLHTAGYLLIMGLVALIVYEKLGLRLLRSAWLNLDLIWSIALLVTAGLTLLI